MRENLHIRQSSAQAAGQAIKNKPATTRDTAGSHRQLSGAPSTYDREKKSDVESAVEPVDCQDDIANSSEARRQPR